MATYYVEKRIINNYLVKVEADSPESAIREVAEGGGEEPELVSRNESGDDFYPSEWRVYLTRDDDAAELDVDSSGLTDLD